MKLLLDTHLLLWAAFNRRRLPAKAAAWMARPDNGLLFSAASIAEIAIKVARGRPDFDVDPRVMRRLMLENGYEELPVTGAHAAAVADLPPLDGDPFDRLLVAQATVEGITLLTSDAVLAQYPGPIRRV